MRVRRFSMLLLAALSAFGSLAAATLDEPTVRRELQTAYGKFVLAYKNKDAKAVAARFTPDAQMVSWDGKKTVGRKGIAAVFQQDMAVTTDVKSAQYDIRKLTLRGKEAIADYTETWRYKMLDPKGEYGAKGRSYQVAWSQKGRDTWVKTQHGWLLKRTETLTAPRLTVGGKPLRPLAKKKV